MSERADFSDTVNGIKQRERMRRERFPESSAASQSFEEALNNLVLAINQK